MAVVLTTAGMNNPMTTSQDLIVAGTSGNPARLGVGANGQVLTVTAGVVGWAAASSGFSNPMTTTGDLIKAGAAGVAQRLAVGSANQYLGVSGGAPAWAQPDVSQVTGAAPLASPTFTGAPAAPTPASGDNSTKLATTAFVKASKPSVVMFPSGDTSGATDDANMTAAIAALPNGGQIQLVANFNTPFYTASGWTIPAETTSGTSTGGGPVCLEGVGMPRLVVVGAAVTGVSYHRTDTYGGDMVIASAAIISSAAPGYIRNLVIDGTSATGASTGLSVGDGWGFVIDNVWVINFTGTGAIGFNQINNTFWTEKSLFRVHAINCSQCVQVAKGASGNVSHEYNTFDLSLSMHTDQSGVIIKNGCGGCDFYIRGNVTSTSATTGPPTNNAAICAVTTANGNLARGFLKIAAEASSTVAGHILPYVLYSDGSGTIKNMTGDIETFALTSNMNGAECSLAGYVATGAHPGWPASGGYVAIANTGGGQTAPATGSVWTNLGPDVLARISGGSGITDVVVNGTSTGATSGFTVPVAAGGTLKINYTTTAPTVTFIPANLG